MNALLNLPVEDVARRLIGAVLMFQGVGGVVVETEAYDSQDPASHSFSGPTPRNAQMFGPPGRAYIYRAYGLHWCLNLVCGPCPGGAVLFRALQPTKGLDGMIERRGLVDVRRLAAGPGRLCQALGVTAAQNGLDMTMAPFDLQWPSSQPEILVGPRNGITKAVDRPWRFGIAGSGFLSRSFRSA
ncbi:DNA-3-methyladenine glycosylase [soil metagenome]